MSYATAADLSRRFGEAELAQLADPLHTGEPDAAVLALALADAEAEIDGYLAARYQLPLPVVPAVLVRVAADIARYRLWADKASEEVRRRYEDAVKLLALMGKGAVALGLPEGSAAPEPSLASFVAGPVRQFGRDNTAGY